MTTSPRDQSFTRYSAFADFGRINAVLGRCRHLRRLSDYVDQHIGTPFRLADAAADVGISRSRLSHLFIEKTGVSFSDWIRHKRIRQAAVLLATDDRPIAEIALATGFDNTRGFERAFKKTTGITATEYRETPIPHQLSLIQHQTSEM